MLKMNGPLALMLLVTVHLSLLNATPMISLSNTNPKCSKGIAYWCQDSLTAKECRRTEFCVNVVWKLHLTKEDSSLSSSSWCEKCQSWVVETRSLIDNHETSEIIVWTVKQFCDLFPISFLKTACSSLVDKEVFYILELLESNLLPVSVCSTLGLCEKFQYGQNFDVSSFSSLMTYKDFNLKLKHKNVFATNEVHEDIKKQPQCVLCEFIMTKLDGELNDKKTDAEIKTALRNICIKMPSTVAKPCKQFIDYFFNMIIVFIETMAPSKVCAEMKLCKA